MCYHIRGRGLHMKISDIERCAEILKVLAHPVRFRLVHQLLKKKKLNAMELQWYLSIPQATVSQHLHKMKNHRVVVCVRKGADVHYRVNDKQVRQTMKAIYLLNK